MKDKKYLLVIPILLVLLLGIGAYYYFTKDSNMNNTINIDYDKNVSTDNLNSKTVSSNYKITEEGEYTLSGEINETVYINSEGVVKLILDNVTITTSDGPCIYVENAKDVVIEIKDGTTNTLTDSSSYSSSYSEANAVIYSKDDLYFEGSGKLIINANMEDAIASNDDLVINNGVFEITSSDDGIRGKDSVVIYNGTFNINVSGNAIKSTNDTDASKGYIVIENGTFNITSGNDAVDALTNLVIKGGTFNITTTGKTNSDSDSYKGLKAGNTIEIDGGTITINSKDDSIHSDGNVLINAGVINITSSDDGIHADGLVNITDGNIDINAHEGIEGTYVKIDGGTIKIKASDDGINAGNKSSAYSVTIEINGGNITIDMGQGDTDAIDSNGNIYINGGTINITAQSAFDYDGEAKYTGGTMIVNGTETTTITNQFAGGMQGGMMDAGQMQPGQRGGQRR